MIGLCHVILFVPIIRDLTKYMTVYLPLLHIMNHTMVVVLKEVYSIIHVSG